MALRMRGAPPLVVAYRAATFVHPKEVNAMSCPNENCRKGGCSTEPRPAGGKSPKQR